MTTTTETKEQKAERLAKLGFIPARGPGRCCLCSGKIAPGQFIGRMPSSWRPEAKRRHAHYKCIEQRKAAVEAKAERLGVVAPAGSVTGG